MPANRTIGIPQITGATIEEVRRSTEFWLQHITNSLDEVMGLRGQPTFHADIDVGQHRLKNLAVPEDGGDAVREDRALTLSSNAESWDAQGRQILNVMTGQAELDGVNVSQLEQRIADAIAIAVTALLAEPYVTAAASATLTAERVLTAEVSVTTVLDGGANSTIIVGLATNGVSNTKLRQGVATSVIGRSANSLGNVADIAAATDAHVLQRLAGALVFGLLTRASLSDGAATSVIGRSANSVGAVADIAATTDAHVLRRLAGVLGFGLLTTASLSDYEEGTFTVTGTGFTVNPTGTARYIKIGNNVTLFLPLLNGTSNATSFTITGLPAAVTPARIHHHTVFCTDNGVQILAVLYTGAASTTLTVATLAAGNLWVNAGQKTLHDCYITYTLL